MLEAPDVGEKNSSITFGGHSIGNLLHLQKNEVKKEKNIQGNDPMSWVSGLWNLS